MNTFSLLMGFVAVVFFLLEIRNSNRKIYEKLENLSLRISDLDDEIKERLDSDGFKILNKKD